MSETKETLELLKIAQAAGDQELTKYFTQTATATQGLQAYNLEAPSKKLYPKEGRRLRIWPLNIKAANVSSVDTKSA